MKKLIQYWLEFSTLCILGFKISGERLEGIPNCWDFYYNMDVNEEGDGLVSFIAPKTSVRTGFVLKVVFAFPYQSVSESVD